MVKKTKENKISYWAAHLTTIVSVTLLLVLVGLIVQVGIAAVHTADTVKQQQQISIIMADGVTDARADSLSKVLLTRPYTSKANVVTAAEALADWNEATGDDVEAIAGYNFFTPEIELYLNASYASSDSIALVAASLSKEPLVSDVIEPESEVLSSMDNFFSRTLLLLGGVAVVMIIISFMLINNTVLLTIYSRRFTIHTMQLVGASSGFIRRPFIRDSLIAGLVAGVLASALLAVALGFIQKTQMHDITDYVSWGESILVMFGLIGLGMALCSLSALIATNRYLHKDYDQLFK